MKNTLEHLKKAYGKELLNGINHFKLSNYPLDFFFSLKQRLAKGASVVCLITAVWMQRAAQLPVPATVQAG